MYSTTDTVFFMPFTITMDGAVFLILYWMIETLADSGDLTRLPMVWTTLTGLPGRVIYVTDL